MIALGIGILIGIGLVAAVLVLIGRWAVDGMRFGPFK